MDRHSLDLPATCARLVHDAALAVEFADERLQHRDWLMLADVASTGIRRLTTVRRFAVEQIDRADRSQIERSLSGPGFAE